MAGATLGKIVTPVVANQDIILTGPLGTASLPGVAVEFLLTSLVVVLIPRTGVVYTVSSSIGGGRRRGLIAAVGCTLGIIPHMLAAMLGLSGIMQAGSVVFEVVRWAGVAYLVFMGVSMIREAVDASPGLLDARLIGLGGVFMLMTLAVFAVYALASAAARDLILAAPVARQGVERALGAFLIGFAARFALTDR